MLRLDCFVRSETNVLLRGTFAQQVMLCKNVFLQLSILLNNMASAPDSQPFFEQHATKIGMERALLDKFIAGGIRTVSQAAYAAAPPGQTLNDEKVTALCNTLGENRPTLNQLTVVKRLLFEAQTMSLAHLKANIEQQPDSAVRKLPGAERAQRLELQATRLGGLEIRNDLEPAFCVYDSVTTQIEQGSLKYIHPSKVPTRQQELSQAKPAKELTLDASGNGLAIHDKPSKVQAQLGTEMTALQRRGLAYDLIGVLSFRVHERWLQKAFAHMSNPAPPGYNRPTLQQVLRADRALWLELASRQPTLTRSAANAPVTDARCLDKPFEEASNTMDVNFHFMPLQQTQQLRDKGGHWGTWKRWGDGKGGQWTPQEKWQRTDKGKTGGKSPFKGKDDGKGKGEGFKGAFANRTLDYRTARRTTPMPAALRGGVPCDDSGEAMCFGFGLGQCKEAPVGGRCAKGRHVCCFPGCFGKHPFTEHKGRTPKA